MRVSQTLDSAFAIMMAIQGLLATSSASSPAAAPYSDGVPGQGEFSELSADAATFKEVDYQGHQQERLRYTEAVDFTMDFPGEEGRRVEGKGGQSLQINIDDKPAMYNSQSMSQSMFTLVPCGLNVPHLHPRAGKVLHVTKGEVTVGFVEENGGRAISQNVTMGQSFIIPAGLAMWVHNLGCEEAQYLDTWQNSDPGILNMVEALFKMPVETVAAAMQVDLSTAQDLMQRQLSPIELGPDECLARCNATNTASLNMLYGPLLSPVATLESSGR